MKLNIFLIRSSHLQVGARMSNRLSPKALLRVFGFGMLSMVPLVLHSDVHNERQEIRTDQKEDESGYNKESALVEEVHDEDEKKYEFIGSLSTSWPWWYLLSIGSFSGFIAGMCQIFLSLNHHGWMLQNGVLLYNVFCCFISFLYWIRSSWCRGWWSHYTFTLCLGGCASGYMYRNLTDCNHSDCDRWSVGSLETWECTIWSLPKCFLGSLLSLLLVHIFFLQ